MFKLALTLVISVMLTGIVVGHFLVEYLQNALTF